MKIKFFLFVILFIGLLYFPVFLHLSFFSLRDWDESHLACNALEMIDNGNIFVTYYNGSPDMWNVKPPLMIWLQAISLKTLGYNELAVRLPSALAVLLTVFLIMYFCKKQFKSKLLAYLAALILITSSGYISGHISRTGDYDALLTFFTTFYIVNFFAYLYTDRDNKKYLYLTAIGITLALLTKGIQGLIFLPVMFIFVLYKKKFKLLVSNRHFYFSIIIILIFGIGYYLLRESMNPGYLSAVYNNELGGRYFKVNEGHEGTILIYFLNFINWRFIYWVPLFFLSFILLISNFDKEEKKLRGFLFYIFSLSVFYFLIISLSKTKLVWYDAPLYPLLAIICAFPLKLLINEIKNKYKGKSVIWKYSVAVVTIVFIFYLPYRDIIYKNLSENKKNDSSQWLYYGYFMKQLKNTKKYTIVINEDYKTSHIKFYKDALNKKGYSIKEKIPSDLVKNEIAMVCEDNSKQKINAKYNYTIINSWKNCELIKINSVKGYEK